MSPLALDPEARFEIVLATDAHKPDPPAFVFRYLADRDWRAVARVYDHVAEIAKEGLDAMLGALEDALRIPLVGWRGMADPATGKPIPYDPRELDRVLAPNEVNELLRQFIRQSQLGPDEKKGSGSQSPMSSGASAAIATPRSAEGESVSGAAASQSSSAPSAAAEGGCSECTDGWFELNECPVTFAGKEAFEMLRAVDLLEMGLAPVGGGSLDQTRVFNQAARFVMAERRWNEAALKTGNRR